MLDVNKDPGRERKGNGCRDTRGGGQQSAIASWSYQGHLTVAVAIRGVPNPIEVLFQPKNVAMSPPSLATAERSTGVALANETVGQESRLRLVMQICFVCFAKLMADSIQKASFSIRTMKDSGIALACLKRSLVFEHMVSSFD